MIVLKVLFIMLVALLMVVLMVMGCLAMVFLYGVIVEQWNEIRRNRR